jgi:hypothetical protein
MVAARAASPLPRAPLHDGMFSLRIAPHALFWLILLTYRGKITMQRDHVKQEAPMHADLGELSSK